MLIVAAKAVETPQARWKTEETRCKSGGVRVWGMGLEVGSVGQVERVGGWGGLVGRSWARVRERHRGRSAQIFTPFGMGVRGVFDGGALKKRLFQTTMPESPTAFLPLGVNGEILSVAMERIEVPWDEAMEAVAELYRSKLGKALRCVYVHGSVARGTAVLGRSDLDTFCITRCPSNEVNLGEFREERVRLESLFPFADRIELGVGSLDELLDSQPHNAMVIKTMALCVYGECIGPFLPDFKPDHDLAWINTRNFPRFLSQGLERMRGAAEEGEYLEWCQWTMKRLVRAGFSLVMPRKREITLDLAAGAEVFCAYYPGLSREMLQALNWTHSPPVSRASAVELAEALGCWLKEELAREIRIERPSR